MNENGSSVNTSHTSIHFLRRITESNQINVFSALAMHMTIKRLNKPSFGDDSSLSDNSAQHKSQIRNLSTKLHYAYKLNCVANAAKYINIFYI